SREYPHDGERRGRLRHIQGLYLLAKSEPLPIIRLRELWHQSKEVYHIDVEVCWDSQNRLVRLPGQACMFGEIQRRVSTEEFQIALKAYWSADLGNFCAGPSSLPRDLHR